MNLSSYGSENIILTGNPTKTMFKAVYHKYTNFGMQTFYMKETKQQFKNVVKIFCHPFILCK